MVKIGGGGGGPFTLHIHNTYTKTYFSSCPLWSSLLADSPVVRSASREHQDSALPENLLVHPTKSICSDLWCWAAQCLYTARELLDTHTFLFGRLADCCLSLSHQHTQTHVPSLSFCWWFFPGICMVPFRAHKGLRLACVNAYIMVNVNGC